MLQVSILSVSVSIFVLSVSDSIVSWSVSVSIFVFVSGITASISDSALDNDHLNSDATTPYPNSIAIDDFFDYEQVTSLMQDVDNLSKVPPFNILDSETRHFVSGITDIDSKSLR